MSSPPTGNTSAEFSSLCLDLLRIEPEPAPDGLASRLRSACAPERAAEQLVFLSRHRLDQLFLRALLDRGLEPELSPELLEPLKTARRRRAIFVLLQQEAAQRATKALEVARIDSVFFKGFQLGEQLYGDAVLRPSADLDLLIDQKDRTAATAALGEAGFELVPQEDAPDYEITLFGHGTALDLHWHLIQPQRSRVPLTPRLLESRHTVDGFGFPDAEMGLIVLLLNPAITDHVSERMIQAVDIDRWLRRFSPPGGGSSFDWNRCLDLLSAAGLATAAWAMLSHTRALFGTPLPTEVERRLRPGPLRRSYLRAWIRRDPARIYQHHPLWVRVGFSLWLQDRPRDIWRFLRWYLSGSPSDELC